MPLTAHCRTIFPTQNDTHVSAGLQLNWLVLKITASLHLPSNFESMAMAYQDQQWRTWMISELEGMACKLN